MYSKNTVVATIKKKNFVKIAVSFVLAFSLFLTTALGNSSAIAASNKSATTYPTDDGNVEGLLYSDGDRAESLDSVDDFVSNKTQKKVLDPTQIPAQKQPILDRSDPDANLLEKTKQMFDDAADFSAN